MLLFTETGEGGGNTTPVYLRRTEAPARSGWGKGRRLPVSPDGQWAAVSLPHGGAAGRPSPHGAGDARRLSFLGRSAERGGGELVSRRRAPGGVRVGAGSQGSLLRGGRRRPARREPLTPEGVRGVGLWGGTCPRLTRRRRLLVRDARDESANPLPVAIYSLPEAALRPVAGWKELEGLDTWIRWSADGRALLAHVHTGTSATRLVRFDLTRGVWEDLRTLTLADPAGIFIDPEPVMTPDQKYYAYFYLRVQSDLYLADGLR